MRSLTRRFWPSRILERAPAFVDRKELAGCEHGAPVRLLVYEDERGRTCLEYDKPSSLFGQFNDDRIAPTAAMLDNKLEALVAAAIR